MSRGRAGRRGPSRRRGSLAAGAVAALAAVASLAAFPPDGGAQSLRDARDAERGGRYEEALGAYRGLMRRGEAYPEADRGRVRTLLEVGRYGEAADVARASAAGHPGSAELHRLLGDALARRGRLEDAEAAYRTSVAGGASDRLTAELRLAELGWRRGEHEAAFRALEGVVGAYRALEDPTARELTAVADALARLGIRDPGRFRDALRLYDEAIDADPGDPTPRVRLGELFLEKYNSREAGPEFEAVLEANPAHPGALLGLARKARFDGVPGAMERVRAALETNPDLVPARTFLARLHLDLEEAEAAAAEARRALEVDPGSLEALAVLAAARHLRGDRSGFEAARDRALSLNPRYAGLFVVAAEAAVRNRLYADAVAFARRGAELDARAWDARALLGLNLLRVGEIEAGRRALEAAFRGDPYNVWVKNTLDLLDTFDRYREVASPRFRFLAEGDEAELLGLYAPALAEEAYDVLAGRYGYRPAGPLRVELYPRHADFSVRTVGLAGMGALGVSFGTVLAMDSPSAREPGSFNWGSTLWHEISHAFTLGITGHRIPRWFSEGLAVHDERKARPGWGSGPTPDFLAAYRAGRLPPVGELNRGFVRPAYPGQVRHAYYQAALVCAMIEERHGEGALLRMLEGYRDGLDTEAVFRRVLGADAEALDRRFRDWMEARFQGPLAALPDEAGGGGLPSAGGFPSSRIGTGGPAPDPGDYAAQLARGRALAEAGRDAEAVPHLERALELFPEYAGPGSPHGLLARIHAAAGRTREAAGVLEALVSIDETSWEAHRELARLRTSLGDREGAAEALERAIWIHPFEIPLHERLAALYEALDRPRDEVRERRALVALEPVDRAAALYRLALAHRRAGQTGAARRAVLRALEVAPRYREAQELLLDLREEPEGEGGPT